MVSALNSEQRRIVTEGINVLIKHGYATVSKILFTRVDDGDGEPFDIMTARFKKASTF